MADTSAEQSQPQADTRRWGGGTRIDDRELGAEKILIAARTCFADAGISGTSIEAIATQAGVSRRTVYRYFDSKEAIVRKVVEAQAEPFFEEMRASLQARSDLAFRDMLQHCVLFAIDKGPQMEGHQLLLGERNAAATVDFYLGSPAMRDHLHSMLEEAFAEAQYGGEIPAGWRLDDVLNWAGRLVYSFIQYPAPAADVERLVKLFLLPDRSALNRENG